MPDDSNQPANPFASPMSEGGYSSGVDPSTRTVEMLRQTRPWVRFLAILGVVGMVFMAIAMLFMFAAAAGVVGGGGVQQGAPSIVLAVIYLLMLVLYYFPVSFLFRYSRSIQQFVELRTTEHMDDALEAQKSFWKFCGIVMAIYLGFIVLMLLFGVLGAAFTVAS